MSYSMNGKAILRILRTRVSSSLGRLILEFYVQVKNETHALWSWHRNQDMYDEAGDQIYIVRQPERCPVRQHKKVIELWGTENSNSVPLSDSFN